MRMQEGAARAELTLAFASAYAVASIDTSVARASS
jgi:hypothetical protein